MYDRPARGRHPGEPGWHSRRTRTRSELPAATARWLLDEGSLTRHLIRASGGQFRVRVRYQGWARPRASERRLLNIPPRRQALVREVQLECGGVPWVFARSVLPASSLNGKLRHLRKFRDSSLGQLLFSDPAMRRGTYEVVRGQSESLGVPRELATGVMLWGRRSLFRYHGKPIMVSELFLPDFEPFA